MPRRRAPGPDELDADLFAARSAHDGPARSAHDGPEREAHDGPARSAHDGPARSTHDGAARSTHDGAARSAQHESAIATALTSALDLHHFLPRECADVVAEYLHAAQAAGFRAVRIIHGKGTGALRRTVHATLDRHPAVRAYRLADHHSSWGATLVELVPAER